MSQVDEKTVSPEDFQDLDMERLRVLADYVMKNSVPVNMTIVEAQEVVNIYMELLNLSLHNLNLLRKLAGEDEFEVSNG